MDAQQRLPFAEAEGSYAERKALLWAALGFAGANRTMMRLCEWVFEHSGGGLASVVASRRQLAAGPWGCACSPASITRAIANTVRMGLLTAQECWDANGRQQASAYGIHWSGVRALLQRHTPHPPAIGRQNEHPGAQNEPAFDQPPAARLQGEPGGETPRAGARAPFVRSSSL